MHMLPQLVTSRIYRFRVEFRLRTTTLLRNLPVIARSESQLREAFRMSFPQYEILSVSPEPQEAQ